MNYLFILLISILYTILFYGKVKGLSMLLFTIIFLVFTKYYLKKQDLIKNKKAFLYMIPIILLSLTYLLFDNYTFNFLNYYAIILLYNYMVISVTNKKELFINILRNSIKLVFDSIRNALKSFNEATSIFKSKMNIKKIVKYLKSIIVTIIFLVIIINLLSSADLIFKSLFSGINKTLSNILNNIFASSFIYKIIYTFLIFILISGLFYSINKNKLQEKEIKLPKVEHLTIKMILGSLNIIYLVFCISQIKSLFLKSLPSNYIYSTYAKEGFFQLLFVSVINILLVLYSKKIKNNDKFITISTLLMVIFNYIIVFSSFYRMYLYELQYGYTYLRLSVYCFLVLELIIFIPTILYILNKKIDLLKVYFNIFIIWYVVINFMNFDYIISYNNVNRFIKGTITEEKLDTEYLSYNTTSSAVDNILKLDNKLKSKEKKSDIALYKDKIISTYRKDIREFNLSKYIAYKKVKRA